MFCCFAQEVDEITDDDIAAVADRSTGKIYNQSLVSFVNNYYPDVI